MPYTLKELDAISAARTQQALQSQFTTQAINPPTWKSVTTPVAGTLVFLLNEPVKDNGQGYLLTGGGIGAPVTGSKSPMMFFYQFSVSANSNFSSDTILDSGSSRSYTYSSATSLYVRARARLVNGPFSEWKPYGSAAGMTPTFRPFEFTAVGNGAVNPYLGMDGDTTTSASISSAGVNIGEIWGPFFSPANLTSGMTLSVVTSAQGFSGTAVATISYSVDAGASYTTIRSAGTTWAKTTDTVTLPTNFNLGLLRVQAFINPGSGGAAISYYEGSVQ